MTSSVFILFTEQNKNRRVLPPSSKRGNEGFGGTNIPYSFGLRWEFGELGYKLNSESEEKFGPIGSKTQIKLC